MGGSIRQGLKAQRGAQVCEHRHLFAQAQEPRFGAFIPRRARPLRTANRAHQHGVCGLGGGDGFIGDRHARSVQACPAEGGFGHGQIWPKGLGDALGLRGHFGADPVAGQQQQGLVHKRDIKPGRRAGSSGPFAPALGALFGDPAAQPAKGGGLLAGGLDEPAFGALA